MREHVITSTHGGMNKSYNSIPTRHDRNAALQISKANSWPIREGNRLTETDEYLSLLF